MATFGEITDAVFVTAKVNLEHMKAEIKSNLDEEMIEDFLCEWLRLQVGKGVDDSKPTEREEYEITILLNPTNDQFTVLSNTDNKGLTTGLIIYVVQTLRNKRTKGASK